MPPDIEFLRLPKSSLMDVLGPILVIIFLLVVAYFARKALARQTRAKALVRKKTARKNRRQYQRLPVSIPVRLTSPDKSRNYVAEVIDISIDGIRLLAPLEGIAASVTYTLTSEASPWRELGNLKLLILRMSRGPDKNTAILRGRWMNLKREQRIALKREIKKQLKERVANRYTGARI